MQYQPSNSAGVALKSSIISAVAPTAVLIILWAVLDPGALSFSEAPVMLLGFCALAFLFVALGLLLFALPVMLFRLRVSARWVAPAIILGGGLTGALLVPAAIFLFGVGRLPIAAASALGAVYGACAGTAWWLLARRRVLEE